MWATCITEEHTASIVTDTVKTYLLSVDLTEMLGLCGWSFGLKFVSCVGCCCPVNVTFHGGKGQAVLCRCGHGHSVTEMTVAVNAGVGI